MKSILKNFIKNIYLKWKWRKQLKFYWTDQITIRSVFEGMNQIHPYSFFDGELGYGSYIGPKSIIHGKIGRYSSIAQNVICNPGRHPYTYPFVSTAPCFYSLNPYHSQNGSTFATKQCFQEIAFADTQKKYPVIIGNDCWIGEGVFLVGGIHIENGAIVLARSVVTKDVPPFAIVGGVPAKIIGYRYSKHDIEFILKSKWWNNPPQWFKNNWELLNNLDCFKDHVISNSGN